MKLQFIITLLATFGLLIGLLSMGVKSWESFGVGAQQGASGIKHHKIARLYASEGATLRIVDGEIVVVSGTVITSRPEFRRLEEWAFLFLLLALWIVGSAYKRELRARDADPVNGG